MALDMVDVVEAVEKTVAGSTPKMKQMFELRFKKALTLTETGKQMGVSRTRVRNLEAKLLRKALTPEMRKVIGFKRLEGYLEVA